MRRRQWLFSTAALLAGPALSTQAFDHAHADWTALLKKHVVLLRGGQASQVRYAGFAADRVELKRYLETLSALPRSVFDTFKMPQQQAFFVNAYNAFTVELILTKYPNLQSIKDLGGWLSSPWDSAWIQLLGAKVSLDDIEHGMLRQRGVYDDPRVHFAVNCASVGCPMLREEAFTADLLAIQLEQQTQRFMSDRSRNRWNTQRGRLELSKIFEWYGEDFRLGHQGIDSLAAFSASHANRLADAPADRERIRSGRFDTVFLDYDWALNDVRRSL
ncbi:MAG: hypothetical protein ACI87L_001729 [Litorivivens sp.]|jgi:hypothetical protein